MTEDERLERWLAALVATPGLTAVSDLAEARQVHVDDALAALEFLTEGPVVDVGSGGGSPGLPLAAARPDLDFALLESQERKCLFLRGIAHEFPNVSVVCARAEEHAAAEGRDAYGTALARALAAPPVAVEWCLPLVRPGGLLVLFAGEPDERAGRAARLVGGGQPTVVAVAGSERRHLLLVPKVAPTPAQFPRRPGMARKRPLA